MREFARIAICLLVVVGVVLLAVAHARHETATAEVYFDDGHKRFPIFIGQSTFVALESIHFVGGGGMGGTVYMTRTVDRVVVTYSSNFNEHSRTEQLSFAIADLPVTWSGIVQGWIKRVE